MPSEYTDLVERLQETSIPFAEYGWKNRPKGIYGIVGLDFESDSEDSDDAKGDTSWEASVDVFFPKLADRETVRGIVEPILAEVCGASWWLNSLQHESDTGYFHIEWACEVQDNPEEDETDAVPAAD